MNSIMQILQTTNPATQPSTSPLHFWRVEPAPNVDPALAKRSPWYSVQHVFCRRDTGEIVGIMRRLKGEFKTAWFSGNSVTVKRHYSMQAAKKFLERQFTRTVPSSIAPATENCWARNTEHAPRFNIVPFPVIPPARHPSLCTWPHRKVLQVNFARSQKSKIEIQKSKITSSPSISHTQSNASPNRH